MEELKLECLVKGYEGTYFEVGQVWETKSGCKLKVKGFDFETDIYKLTMTEGGGSTGEYYYTSKGEDEQGRESDLDLVRLISTETPTESIPSEEPQPKTLSEYLKENNAYESFVENCVEYYLQHILEYKDFSLNNREIRIESTFYWRDTEQGSNYWYELNENRPKNLVYDMNEIVFAEVDRRIAEQDSKPEFISTKEFEQMLEQKASTKYMVFVEGGKTPKKIHDSYDSAETEAKRLSAKEIGCNVFVVEIVKTFKSKVIVEEI